MYFVICMKIYYRDFPDDTMKIVRIFIHDILTFKITQLILFATFVIHLSTTLIQIYFFCINFKLYYFVKYAPVFFSSFYVRHYFTRITYLFLILDNIITYSNICGSIN